MRLTRRQFDLTALTVLCASWLHAPHFPFWLNVAITLVIALRWLQRRLRPDWGKPPALLRLPLTLALPVAVWLQYGNIFGLDPGSVFAVGMLVLKLTESETARDARAVATFAMFVLMAALLFEQDLLTTLYVGIGVIPLLIGLRALEYDDATTPTPTPSLANFRANARAVLANVFAAVPLALLVFLFLPRLAAPLWATQTSPQGKTGLNDSMSPGNLGELLLDDSPAFRVSFDTEAPPPTQRYWRGIVLWRYDGQRWSRAGGLPRDATRQPLRVHGADINYEITQEPSQRRWMFALDLPTSDTATAERDEDYTLAASRPVGKLTVYRLSSAPQYSLTGLDARQRERGLRLPPNFNPRTVALGQQWAQENAHDTTKIVQAGLNYIRREFRYTLTPPPLGRQAMDDFLFETKAGYCEHFSSAFAVLMRAAGVPTRIVLGYQGGYWSDVGGYMVIRQSDAHAWNEVWFPERGWVRVDPTAAVRPDRVELGAGSTNADNSGWFGREWMLEMRNRWDLVNHLWTRVVVQFDELTQSGLLRSVGIEKADWRELGIAFAICMGLLAALGLWWAMHRDRRRGDALDHAYDRLCARLASSGLARAPAEGPADYLQRVLQALPQARGQVEPLFARYMQLRYAQHTGDALQVREFARAVGRADLRRLRAS